MKRILIVDDDSHALERLERALVKLRGEWAIVLASSGEAALGHLDKGRFDAIVTDMRMPGIDGGTLLKIAQDRDPAMVRIILAAQSEEDEARRVVFCAHQFLAKPADPGQLRDAIERGCALNALLQGEELQRTVGRIGQLPALPSVYTELVRILQDPGASMKDVARTIEKDPAICAKTLQVVNSAFFGLPRRMDDVEQAVCYLGVDVLKGLALMIEVFQGRTSAPAPGLDLEAERAHALVTARIARRLLQDRTAAQSAFIAGMLHDCGRLIVATRLPELHATIDEEARRSARRHDVVEEEILGVSHAAVGAYLLGLWNLPFVIVEAVAHHHVPSNVPQSRFGVLGAVHVADRLARETVRPESAATTPSDSRLDWRYLETMGVLDRLPSWRQVAAEEKAELAPA